MLFLSSADFFQNQLFRKILLGIKSLDPDKARHFVGPDLDPSCFDPDQVRHFDGPDLDQNSLKLLLAENTSRQS